MWFKNLITPKTNETKNTIAVKLWKVRWQSRYGSFNGDTQPEMEAFTSEEDAKEFAKSLEAAFRLIRHTSGNKVVISIDK